MSMCRTVRYEFVCFAIAVLSLGAHAQEAAAPVNLVKNGDAETGTTENWKNWSSVATEGVHEGLHCFMRKGLAIVESKEPIPIDTGKTYVLSGWFECADREMTRVYLGYRPLDEKKRGIAPVHVNVVAKTETTLAEPCRKADKVVRIVDGSKWKKDKYGVVAFDVDDSGEYADLPNRNITSYGIESVEDKGDHWELALKGKVPRDYPAGTKVRMQRAGGTYIYNAGGYVAVPNKWTQLKGKITGEAKFGAPSDKWWRGTKYATIVVLANYNPKAGQELLADDISMVELEAPAGE